MIKITGSCIMQSSLPNADASRCSHSHPRNCMALNAKTSRKKAVSAKCCLPIHGNGRRDPHRDVATKGKQLLVQLHLPRLLAELQQLLQLVVDVVVLAFNLILVKEKH